MSALKNGVLLRNRKAENRPLMKVICSLLLLAPCLSALMISCCKYFLINVKLRLNGTFERISGDIVLLCNYSNKYRKDTKLEFKWLNENAALCDFENVDSLLTRLTASIEPIKEIRALFNSKNTSVFVTAFKAFAEMGRKDREFGAFLKWFVDGGKDTEINGKTWETLDTWRATRDSSIVHGKIDYLVAVMEQYFKEVSKAA